MMWPEQILNYIFSGTNKEFIGGKAEKQIKNLLIICLKSSTIMIKTI